MTQKFHRYLNLPFDIDLTTMFDFDLKENDHKILDANTLGSEVNKWLRDNGLICGYAEAFYTAPNSSLIIHCDSPTLDNHVKINFTHGDDSSKTRWWKVKDESLLQRGGTEYGADILWAEEKDCDLAYEATINKPSLMNVGQLHSTYNPSDTGRWTLCIVPGTKQGNFVSWTDALELFEEYLA